VDNLTHSMAGWALGQAGLKTKTRKGLAALILGANAPDIDVFFQWASWEPLATHRGFLHSFLGGVIFLPVLLWGLLLALDRWQVSRGTTFKSGLALDAKWLLALCYIGALTHPLLDLQTTYAIQLFSPASGRWYHSDSLFIIDAWLWLLFLFGMAASQAREWTGRVDYGRPIQIALVAAFGYICLNLGLSQTATDRLLAVRPAATDIFASPPPFAFWRRDISWREGHAVGHARWSMVRGIERVEPFVDDRMDNPVVRAALRQSTRLRKFLGWSILPVATVTREGCKATVAIGDARYSDIGGGRSRLSRETVVDLCA
jgi:inner membrane protein